jgi:putative intracellular protease/amidase
MKVLMPIPELDFDPTEVAVTWRSLHDRGIQVTFATPTGGESEADHIMLTGEGLDPWGHLPLLRRVRLLGLFMRADAAARKAYADLEGDPSFQDPIKFSDMRVEDFDGLVLPGGHRARGMQEYLESKTLRKFIGAFFITGKPVGAICHGVLAVARSPSPLTGKSVLYGRKTTALPWAMERRAWRATRFFGRFWDPHYFRTYVEKKGQPSGSRSVEYEVTAYLEKPTDFIHVEGSLMDRVRKSSGLFRDSGGNEMAAHVVVDGHYVSARWPGDAFTFAAKFGDLVMASQDRAPETASAAVGQVQALADPKYDPFAQTQIVSRLPKAESPVADMNHTIIIRSPLQMEKAKAADETVVYPPVSNGEAKPEPVTQPAAQSAQQVTPQALAPLVQQPAADSLPVSAEVAPDHAAAAEVQTERLAKAPLTVQAPVDEFAKTQVLSAPPCLSETPVDPFEKTQVLAEPTLHSPAAARTVARPEAICEPPLVSSPDDDFAKTQVFAVPATQSATQSATQETTAFAQSVSEPPIVPSVGEDFEKTQILSRPSLKMQRVTSSVDDFDRTMIVTRPSREELEKPEV